MQQVLTTLYSELKYIFWPYLCACCRQFLRNDTLLCQSCMSTVRPIVSVPLTVTQSCTMPVFAIAAYQGPLKRLILAKGWHDQRASIVLGNLLWERTTLLYHEFDIIVPIPLHWTRFAYRGYNQAELIAQQLSVVSGKPMITALERTERTVLQSRLSSKGRAQNVKTVFSVPEGMKEQLRGKRVLLVDDLMTSGATLQAAAKSINKCRSAALSAAVACRVV